jgi:hypothetical protein
LGFDLSRNFKVAALHPHDTRRVMLHHNIALFIHAAALAPVPLILNAYARSNVIERTVRSRVASTSSKPAAATSAPAADTAG